MLQRTGVSVTDHKFDGARRRHENPTGGFTQKQCASHSSSGVTQMQNMVE